MTDVHQQQQQRQQQQYAQNMSHYSTPQSALASRMPNQPDDIVHAMVKIIFVILYMYLVST
jgi:hypothetical protein